MAGKLSAILDLVEQMNAVDTAGIERRWRIRSNWSQRLRADAVTESDRRADFQAIAPQTADGLYLVPRVPSEAGSGRRGKGRETLRGSASAPVQAPAARASPRA